MLIPNPLRYGWHRRARRRRRLVRRNGRRVPAWLKALRRHRSRRNPFTRRRRSSTLARRRRHRRRRHNPFRAFRFSGRTRRRGRRHSRRYRRNPDIAGTITSGLRPSKIKSNIVNGVQGALGWAGTSFLTRLEARYGLDKIYAAAGGGTVAKILGYVVRGINVGLLAGLTRRFVSETTSRNLVMGGVTSIGVQVINDFAPMLGGPGESVKGLLSGVGDYLLAAGPYSTAMRPFGVGDYLLATGQPSLPYAENSPVYGGDDPYGAF